MTARKTTLAATAFLLSSTALMAQDVTLTIESWRNDDISIWRNQIIPAFEAAHPGIKLDFQPTAPAQYNSALNSKLDAGTAGDIVTCRAFDASLALFQKGQLADLTDLDGMANYSDVAKSAWSTDDGSQQFCVPMASVIHGFIYNADAFEELGLEEPTTVDEFFAVLDAIAEDGSYIPMAMGVNDQWEAATMGYANIGPNYWMGEQGRNALIAGEAKLTDAEFVAPFEQLARWSDYLGRGFESQSYPDSQNLFTLGRAAIYPSGSWEIAGFRSLADFEMGAFPPPVQNAGDTCYISDHTDMGMGLNAASPNAEAGRVFLNWLGSSEFANLFANAVPGFFPLSNAEVSLEDPLAQEFISWRGDCESSIRPFDQILSRGTPNLSNESWGTSANVIRGGQSPEDAAAQMQEGLASWYAPQQ
ncbi:MAG: ABC-type N-acetylglucosamine uptake system substrate-binding component [Roseibaca calidilacus]|uniref:Probable sugar-binding periplasmic protein n=1 Tax=Roseibaca calidilacus TaxID=1666912 RepID=A0A0N8K8H7_9RHOB|nr:ABC transporter substrate-binding protein [Roseibaca calidilacus]KPP94569.1 MAG: ABC-type N-acetylglucosamine uptake system substrate-binding component [Roseibaca calidilacus]CUX83246.1 carbohydrate ABC transporter substrate-binding protein, CUT1 family [Roseibaca calidilacus]